MDVRSLSASALLPSRRHSIGGSDVGKSLNLWEHIP